MGSAGRCFYYTGSETLVADGHITILPVSGAIEDGAYVCAYLQSPAGRQQLLRRHRGSSRQIEIYPADFLTIAIPSTSEEVRRKIGRAWLSATEDIERAQKSIREAEGLIEALVGAAPPELSDVHATVWEESLTRLGVGRRLDPEHALPDVRALRSAIQQCGSRPLNALITECSKGVQASSYDENGSIRVVKSKDVTFPEIDLVGCERSADEGWVEFLEPGDLLLNLTGEGTLGRAGVMPDVRESDPKTVAAVDVSILKIDRSQAFPEYIALFLNSWMGRRQTVALQTGSSGQQHLYPAHFGSVDVPMRVNIDGSSDLEWQDKVISVADQRRRAIAKARKVATELDDWFDSLIGVPVDLSTIPV